MCNFKKTLQSLHRFNIDFADTKELAFIAYLVQIRDARLQYRAIKKAGYKNVKVEWSNLSTLCLKKRPTWYIFWDTVYY